MIVFQVFIKFSSSERNTDNTMSHLYLNKGSVEMHAKIKSFTPPFSNIEKNETYSSLASRFITYNIRIGNIDWCKCQKQPLEVFREKGVL